MSNTVVKIFVPLVGLAAALAALFVVYFVITAWLDTPPAVLGFNQAPKQPIAFPHTVHVNVAGLDCQFCHRAVSTDEAATIPTVQQCMFCHATIDGTQHSPAAAKEIQKLRAAWQNQTPIDWVRVHRLPDSVQFIHAPHIQRGITCSTCHGDVASMTEVKQVRNLKMRDCVDCHRANNAPTDCTTCHY